MKGWHKALVAVGSAIGSGVLIDAVLLRPLYLRWGATDEELKKSWPGDELVQRPGQCTRGITIHAPAERIWPWIMQIGQDRGGFCSYTWLENLFLANIRNADSIIPGLRPRRVGDVVWMAPKHRYGGRACMAVAQLLPGTAMVLVQRNEFEPAILGERVHGGIWQFFVEPIDDKNARLIMRGAAPDETILLYDFVFDPAHFIMERKMMCGIKERAERDERLAQRLG
jgi:hypothetical protein